MPGEPNNMGSGEDCASLAIDCIYGFGGVGKQWADSGCKPGVHHAIHLSSVSMLYLHASPMVASPIELTPELRAVPRRLRVPPEAVGVQAALGRSATAAATVRHFDQAICVRYVHSV